MITATKKPESAVNASDLRGTVEMRTYWHESLISSTLGAVGLGVTLLFLAGVVPALVGIALGGATGASIYHHKSVHRTH